MIESKKLDDNIDLFFQKTKRIVDIAFFASLFVFISTYACKLVRSTLFNTEIFYMISTALLTIIAVYRLLGVYIKSKKKALIYLGVLVFGLIVFIFSGNNLVLNAATVAIAGLGFSADYIMAAGIAGNLMMIVNNIIMTLVSPHGIYIVDNQDRQFFGLGNNTFFVSKMNNFSSTDFASHYFWIIAAYLWIRGRKISWGEIAALASLILLIYSLTASKTTLFCVFLLLFITVVMKLWYLLKDKKTSGGEQAETKGIYGIICKIIEFCCKYSFLIFAAAAILLAVLYSNSSTFFLDLNNKLHWRLSLGHRGLAEYGVHLLNSNIYVYGMSSSIDGFYNFLDSSYINLLITKGILVLAFYLISMTVIQIKHKRYVYGAALLAVCALSCFEEHHLPEIPYNMFALLLFSDLDPDNKVSIASAKPKKSYKTLIPVVSWILCFAFAVSTVAVYYPKFLAVKELDRLDAKADGIYYALQDNLDLMINNGSWKANTDPLSSHQYGELLKEPEDFKSVTSVSWSEAVEDPKEHAFYRVSYEPGITNGDDKDVVDLLINDKVKALIGNGSVVVEYDVIKGKGYSVWYSDTPGCYVIPGGRRADRAGRLRTDVKNIEGYSTGRANG